jgi:hypothetical protein
MGDPYRTRCLGKVPLLGIPLPAGRTNVRVLDDFGTVPRFNAGQTAGSNTPEGRETS